MAQAQWVWCCYSEYGADTVVMAQEQCRESRYRANTAGTVQVWHRYSRCGMGMVSTAGLVQVQHRCGGYSAATVSTVWSGSGVGVAQAQQVLTMVTVVI